MTERELFIDHRLRHLREMIRELETEREDLRRARFREAHIDRLELSCNPSMELTI